ncbi:hypothetical protein [Microbulbifer spongiae]|uniref:Uncharacterized protein n=1 Tax=Microbulbifer spongiae TaxID=2944933 RepID=A0ABY9ED41_9GAMM|nr:hypothetical protein [Microbulbifer sp. MI-G]WKD48666.1 hypothetical protein M8T91_12160 [Microbulbifer sp. MI-G]
MYTTIGYQSLQANSSKIRTEFSEDYTQEDIYEEQVRPCAGQTFTRGTHANFAKIQGARDLTAKAKQDEERKKFKDKFKHEPAEGDVWENPGTYLELPTLKEEPGKAVSGPANLIRQADKKFYDPQEPQSGKHKRKRSPRKYVENDQARLFIGQKMEQIQQIIMRNNGQQRADLLVLGEFEGAKQAWGFLNKINGELVASYRAPKACNSFAAYRPAPLPPPKKS